MYLFEAKYVNMYDGFEINRKIELYEEKSEESAYITAINWAYNEKKEEECLVSLELILVEED